MLMLSYRKNKGPMKRRQKFWMKVTIIIAVVAAMMIGGRYLLIKYLKSELQAKLTGCTISSSGFQTTIDFEYINNWIVVKVKLDGSDKEYPFLFDTGAQTVILDSLLKEIRNHGVASITSGTKKESAKHAFRNEIITLKGLTIGDVRFTDIGAITAKSSEWGMLNCITAYGVIGYNVIQTCCFQIDYVKKKIILTDHVDYLSNFNKIDWVGYKPAMNMETPLIPAVINGDIKVDLFFDTGKSGGVSLLSSKLYKNVIEKFPDKSAKFIYSPSIRIRGEDKKQRNSALLKTETFKIGKSISHHLIISLEDIQEREFSGSVGNRYFENFIITLDYANKRVGFISNPYTPCEDLLSYGFTCTPDGKSIFITSVYLDSEPAKKGILPGDEVISINGVRIADLQEEMFCKMYRDEFNLISEEDSILFMELRKNGEIRKFEFKKYKIL